MFGRHDGRHDGHWMSADAVGGIAAAAFVVRILGVVVPAATAAGGLRFLVGGGGVL